MASPDDRETGIGDIAYSLWEREGRPEGQEARHSAAAQEIWAARPGPDGAAPARQPAPAGTPDQPAIAPVPDGEPALAIENQSIPTALGDQEGTTQAPSRPARRQ